MPNPNPTRVPDDRRTGRKFLHPGEKMVTKGLYMTEKMGEFWVKIGCKMLIKWLDSLDGNHKLVKSDFICDHCSTESKDCGICDLADTFYSNFKGKFYIVKSE